MARVLANIKFDQVKGNCTVTIQPIGETEMEHELLSAFFTQRSVTLVPFSVNDRLESRFIMEDKGAFAKSQRACENRIRVRQGQPTVEEQWNKGKTPEEIKNREAANKSAQDAGFVDADAKFRFDEGAKRDKESLALRDERRKVGHEDVFDSNDDAAARAAGFENAQDRDFRQAAQRAGYEGNYKFVPKDVAFDARPAAQADGPLASQGQLLVGYAGIERRSRNGVAPNGVERRRAQKPFGSGPVAATARESASFNAGPLYSGPERRKANAPFQGPDRRVRNAGPSPVPAHPETPFEKHQREVREQSKGPVA